MRLTENDDDYFDEEDYEEEKPVIKKRSFGKRDEEMDDYRHEEESKPRFLPRSSNNKVVQMRRSMEVSLIKPTSMEDTREICDYLLAGKKDTQLHRIITSYQFYSLHKESVLICPTKIRYKNEM